MMEGVHASVNQKLAADAENEFDKKASTEMDTIRKTFQEAVGRAGAVEARAEEHLPGLAKAVKVANMLSVLCHQCRVDFLRDMHIHTYFYGRTYIQRERESRESRESRERAERADGTLVCQRRPETNYYERLASPRRCLYLYGTCRQIPSRRLDRRTSGGPTTARRSSLVRPSRRA